MRLNTCDVFVDGKFLHCFGNPLCHREYGLLKAIRLLDPFQKVWVR